MASSYPNTIVKGSFNDIAHNNIFKVQCEGSFNNIIGNAGAGGGIGVTGDSNIVAKIRYRYPAYLTQI